MTTITPPRPETPRGIEPRLRRGRDGCWCWKFRVRWKDPITGRKRAEQLDTIPQAEAFHARLRLARAHRDVAALSRGQRTLNTFVELEWWPRYAGRRLERSTLRPYASVYNRHLAPHIGRLELRHLTSPRVRDLRELLLDLDVGAPTVRRALSILQGICSYAIEAGELDYNPVRDVEKPAVIRRLAIIAPGPLAVEALRGALDPASAVLVTLIAYEGLRPSEALALEVRHIATRTLLVEQRLVDGAVMPGQKSAPAAERACRTPELFVSAHQDLERHIATLDRRDPHAPLFPGAHGLTWTPREYRVWREDVFKPAVELAGLDIARPYDLRHGCASLLLHAQRPLTEIADHLGHTVATLSRYYAHMIADLRGQAAIPVDHQIRKARR